MPLDSVLLCKGYAMKLLSTASSKPTYNFEYSKYSSSVYYTSKKEKFLSEIYKHNRGTASTEKQNV